MSESNLLGGSRLYTGYGRLRDAAQHAHLPQLVRRPGQVGLSALKHSRLGEVGRLFGRWIRGSWLYRWLTSEPDPDVVVIDLRETWTVGPLIAVLELIFGPLERFWPDSGVRTLTAQTANQVRSAPIRLFGQVVTITVVVTLVLTLAIGEMTTSSLGVRLCALAVGLLATRIDTSWEQLRDGALGRALKAVFEPPEPPE